MCSQGSGERLSTQGIAWWIVLSGQIRNSAPARANLCAEANINSATPGQSPRSMHRMYPANECVCIETSGCSSALRYCGPSRHTVR